MLYIVYLLAGIFIGIMVTIFVSAYYNKRITYGTLRQAQDEDGTYLFLELDREPEGIKQWSKVIFKVNKNDFTSHK